MSILEANEVNEANEIKVIDEVDEREARIEELKARLEARGLLRTASHPVQLPLVRPSIEIDLRAEDRPVIVSRTRPGAQRDGRPTGARRRALSVGVALAVATLVVAAILAVAQGSSAGPSASGVCARFDRFTADLQAGTLGRDAVHADVASIAEDGGRTGVAPIANASATLLRTLPEGTASVAFLSARSAMADACGSAVS